LRGVFYFYRMRSFIYDVLQRVKSQGDDLSKHTFILPSKRAGVFLKHELAKQLDKPQFLPEIISIESFVEELSQLKPVNTLEILFEFYTIYTTVTPEDEQDGFDRFSKWAPTVLQDFNEIDRYLIEPTTIFNYISAVQEINHWSLDPNATEMMKGYLHFWKKIRVYYEALNQHLIDKKIGSQGLIYRQALAHLEGYIKNTSRSTHMFLGFNALNAAESAIIQSLLQHEMAQVFWDSESVFMDNKHHDAGLFMRRYIKDWAHYKLQPFHWISNHYKNQKTISIVGASKAIGQVKYVGQLLQELYLKNKLDNTALVLADESLLGPVLNTLPPELKEINITMGLPLSHAPIASFVEQWFRLHSQKGPSYYHKHVLGILAHPFISKLFPNQTTAAVYNLTRKIKDQNLTFISTEQLKALSPESSSTIELIFSTCKGSPKQAISHLLEILKALVVQGRSQPTTALLELDYLYRFSELLEQLKTYCNTYSFIKSIPSLHHLFRDVLKTETMDFKGQPLQGLQIMGVLESRVLDFETVILVSVNEGILPAGKTQNSFIPFDVKLENKLPTYKEKDAIYTYHFYRLMHRAKQVHLVYNTDSDALKGGEPSRFIAQLELENLHNITHQIIVPSIPQHGTSLVEIPKSQAILRTLKTLARGGFSPSSLGQYIRNPIDFYTQRVLGIKPSRELEETVEATTFGSVVHYTLEDFYTSFVGQALQQDQLRLLLPKIDSTVRQYFMKLYKKGDISTGKNRISFEIAKRYVQNAIQHDITLLEQGHEIILRGVEESIEITLDFPEFDFPIVLKGHIDRLDSMDGVHRIIDYKTSKVEQKELNLIHWGDLTQDYNTHYKSFQVLTYAYMLHKVHPFKTPTEAGILSFKNLNEGVLKFTKQDRAGRGAAKQTVLTPDMLDAYEIQLKALLKDLFSADNSFVEKQN